MVYVLPLFLEDFNSSWKTQIGEFYFLAITLHSATSNAHASRAKAKGKMRNPADANF